MYLIGIFAAQLRGVPMSNELTISDVYSRRKIWTIRVIASLAALLMLSIWIGNDFRNPPLTTRGFVFAGLLGSFFGAAVSAWLLQYAKPSDVEIEGQDGGAVLTGVVAAILSLPLFVIVGIGLAIGAGALSLVLPISYPGPDSLVPPSVLISTIIVVTTVPESSLDDDTGVTIKQNTKTDLSAPPSNTLTHSVETTTDDKQSTTDTDLEKAFEGLIESIENAQRRAGEAIANGQYEPAFDQIKTAKGSCENAAQLNKKHDLGRSNEIATKQSELDHLLSHAKNTRNKESKEDSDEESGFESPGASQKANKLIDTTKEAIDTRQFETAEYRISKIESITENADSDSNIDTTQLNTDLERLEQRLHDEVRKEIQELSTSAEKRYEESRTEVENSDYEGIDGQTDSQLNSALESLTQAENLSNRYDIGRTDSIAEQKDKVQSLLETASGKPANELYAKFQKAARISETVHEQVDEHIEEFESIINELEAQQDRIQRGIHSNDYDHAQDALDQFQDRIAELAELDETDSVVSVFRAEANKFQREIQESKASRRITGFLGAAGSSRSKAEQLFEENAYNRARSRLESAHKSLKQAGEINARYELGREDTISEKKNRIQSLLERTSEKPEEELSVKIEEAEQSVSHGIKARNRDDISNAVEAFETSLNRYETAHKLASEYDLDQQWEVQQRRSMVKEYYDVTQETLDERQKSVEDGLERALEAAESVLQQAAQHIEVNDFLSARESLSEVRGHIDDAAQLLETGVATDASKDRYNDVKQREKRLRERIPDDESEEYRASELVDSLQVLATKIDESPRPEFVNQYGEYPADAYLELFGSWPEALAAANLDPIDEANRERRSYSRVEVLDAMVSLAEELGHPPSKSEMNQKGSMSASPVQSRFNDWETALEVAGIAGDTADEDTEDTDSTDPEQIDEEVEEILDDIESEIQRFDF